MTCDLGFGWCICQMKKWKNAKAPPIWPSMTVTRAWMVYRIGASVSGLVLCRFKDRVAPWYYTPLN